LGNAHALKSTGGMVENEVPAVTEGVGLTDARRKHISDQKWRRSFTRIQQRTYEAIFNGNVQARRRPTM